MPLSSALFSSVTGLDATGTAISVIGDNIANVNTPGFKGRRPEFADVLGQSISSAQGFSQIGAGTKVLGITQGFSQGTFETTNRGTDLAIEGRGFFVLEGAQGTFYSRAGLFNFDKDGYLVNPESLRVQGYGIDSTTGLSNGVIDDISLGTPIAPPVVTGQVNLSLNIDANDGINTFDITDPTNSSSFSNTLSVYDSLGNDHPVTFWYSKTSASASGSVWRWNSTVPSADSTTAPSAGASIVSGGGGNLTFDATGTLTAMTGTPISFSFTGGAAAAQSVAVSYGPLSGAAGDQTTQYAQSSAINSFTQDGNAAGSLQSLVIDREGYLTGQYSNGATVNIAQITLANFPNVQGLLSVGNNNFSESRVSGQPLLGAAQSGNLGSIRSSSLEQSNVDLASEFVRLIINQRAFQANTRTISTTNDLLGALVQLGQ